MAKYDSTDSSKDKPITLNLLVSAWHKKATHRICLVRTTLAEEYVAQFVTFFVSSMHDHDFALG